MSRGSAILVLAALLAPGVLAHEGHLGSEDEVEDDPLAAYRANRFYTVVDDFWTYGRAEKIVPPAALPSTPYRGAWEFDAHGSWLVWIDPTRPGGDLFAYNIDANAGIWLTQDDSEQHRPRVRDGLVVWEDWRDGNPEIYLYDLENGANAVRITNSSANQRNPSLGGGFIVFEDRRDFVNGTDIWIHHLVDGTTEPLVVARGDQTDPVVAGDYVVFRDSEYGQTDLRGVRIRGDRTPFYLTRDLAIETAPEATGALALFLRASGRSWEMKVFDGVRNRTFDTPYAFGQGVHLEADGDRIAYTTYHMGGRYEVYAMDATSGRFVKVIDDIPIRGPPHVANGRIVAVTAGAESKGFDTGIVVVEISRYALQNPPSLVMIGPPPEAPFTVPRFTANGTFRTNPTWGPPLRFEYRLGGGAWTAFDAREGEWNVTVEVAPVFREGQKATFEVRAVFPSAPPVSDRALLTFTRLAAAARPVEVEGPSLLDRLERAIGAIVLTLVALVVLALLLVRMALRGTFRRFFQRRVEAEYLRPDEP